MYLISFKEMGDLLTNERGLFFRVRLVDVRRTEKRKDLLERFLIVEVEIRVEKD